MDHHDPQTQNFVIHNPSIEKNDSDLKDVLQNSLSIKSWSAKLFAIAKSILFPWTLIEGPDELIIWESTNELSLRMG